MKKHQSGILQPLPSYARYLSFSIKDKEEITRTLSKLCRESSSLVDGANAVLGIGQSLVEMLGVSIEGLRHLPQTNAPGLPPVARQAEALWIWLRGEDRGEIFLRSRTLIDLLSPAFAVEEIRDAYVYRDGRDLSGFEDGTENPQGEDAIGAAIVGPNSPLAGSSFVAVQCWQHDFKCFQAMPEHVRNHAIGRDAKSNQELAEAPESAHVKRTAQESFSPEAFVVRRSMPWSEGVNGGLVFVAFGKSFDAFEVQFKRMTGVDDGIVDALFSFTVPVCGAYYWCPPVDDGRLDLSLIGIKD